MPKRRRSLLIYRGFNRKIAGTGIAGRRGINQSVNSGGKRHCAGGLPVAGVVPIWFIGNSKAYTDEFP